MEIQTVRLVLRPVEEVDAKALLPLWSDKEVTQFTYVRDIHTLEDCIARIRRQVRRTSETNGVGPFVVLRKGEIIGFCGLTRKSEQPVTYDMFYHLKKNHWGNGFGFEVAQGLLTTAFLELGADAVTASAVTVNVPSNKILVKNHMRSVGISQDGFENWNGKFDMTLYEIERTEFQESVDPDLLGREGLGPTKLPPAKTRADRV